MPKDPDFDSDQLHLDDLIGPQQTWADSAETMIEDRPITILYGSQTGTAQDVAEKIFREAKRRHFVPTLMAMDSYTKANMRSESMVVFVCSTTGQGDPPDNMMSFWRFIMRKDIPAGSLGQLHHAMLGLGDSSYQKFNFVAKKLNRRLQQLGSTSILDVGLADDSHDLGADAVVYPWLETLWERLMTQFPLPPGVQIIPADTRLPARYKIQILEQTTSTDKRAPPFSDSDLLPTWFPPARPVPAKLISNDRVTAADHFQDTRLIRLDIKGLDVSYVPGDVAVVCPKNSTTTVDMFISHLELDPNMMFTITGSDDTGTPPALPNPCQLRYLVENYWDINCVPRRSFFEMMLYFAEDELERDKLVEFTSSEGQDELFSYCNRVRRTLVEVLQDFPKTSVNIPFEYLFDLIPVLQPRSFSIASSPKAHPNEIQLLVAVVTYKTRLHVPRRGVCSTWLADLDPRVTGATGVTVPLLVKKGTIQFPSKEDTPIIMVGPGTGVAPFRSFVQERKSENKGESILIFGCRYSTKDFYFESEWTDCENSGLLKLITAFSRDDESAAKRFYVQDAIRDHTDVLWAALKRNACFFIAGNAKKMPDAVRESLKHCLTQQGDMSDDEAELYLRDMEKTKRYQAETWS